MHTHKDSLVLDCCVSGDSDGRFDGRISSERPALLSLGGFAVPQLLRRIPPVSQCQVSFNVAHDCACENSASFSDLQILLTEGLVSIIDERRGGEGKETMIFSAVLIALA